MVLLFSWQPAGSVNVIQVLTTVLGPQKRCNKYMLNRPFFKFPLYNPMQQINKSVDFLLPKCSLPFYGQYQHRPSLPQLFQLLVSYSSLSTFKHLCNRLYLSIGFVANTGLGMKMSQTFYLQSGRDTNGWKTPSLNKTMHIIIANIGSYKNREERDWHCFKR